MGHISLLVWDSLEKSQELAESLTALVGLEVPCCMALALLAGGEEKCLGQNPLCSISIC